jgi:antitoxin component of MazEF toxin-antitoxin module
MMKYTSTLVHWGIQWRINIPRDLVEELDWQNGDRLVLQKNKGKLLEIRRMRWNEIQGPRIPRNRHSQNKPTETRCPDGDK